MKKKKINKKDKEVSKMNKNLRYFLWTLVGICLLAGGVFASNVIRSSGTSTLTGLWDFENVSIDYIDENLVLSTLDALLEFKGNSSLLGGSPSSGGIHYNQTIPEAKGGTYWTAWDNDSQQYRVVGWVVCHYNSSSGNGVHSHCSIETLDNSTGTPSINTHFAITYNSSQELAEVTFPNSNVEINGMADFNEGSNVKLTPDTTLDIYPQNQSSISLRVTTDGSSAQLQGLGTSNIQILDGLQVGAGTSQTNITLTSPDGTEYSCGVANGGAFSCS